MRPVVKVRSEDVEFLVDARYANEPDYTVVGGVEDATIAELAAYLDADAENANYHDFVGLGAKLAAIVTRHGGEAAARAVLLEMVAAGGFLGMMQR